MRRSRCDEVERGVHPELGGEERAGGGEVAERRAKFSAGARRGESLGEFDQRDLGLVHGLVYEDRGVEEGVEDVVVDGRGCLAHGAGLPGVVERGTKSVARSMKPMYGIE